MPALDVGPPPPPNPYGRPPTPPDKLGWAIFRHRFLGESYAKVADALDLNNTQTATKRVQKGEARLHTLGVIPWALWPDGKLPARWWADDVFLSGSCRWVEENTGIRAVSRDAANALRAVTPFRR
jgi:hypothetical protein